MKEIIKEIIVRNQQRDHASLIRRDIWAPLNSGKIISFIGPRRAGKTYLLYLLMKEVIKEGVPRDRLFFLNFEDERLISDHFEFDILLQAYQELFPDLKLSSCYFFFDEIQNVKGWEKFVRRLFDDHSKNIYITGSNASFLSTEIATSLRGRSISVEVLPLTFKEFLRFKKINIEVFSYSAKAVLLNAFRDYLSTGGFPELVDMDGTLRTKVLQEYFNVMMYRDLIERFNITQHLVLKYFMKKVFAGIGKTLSVNKIYNDFKSNKYSISKNTLYDFLVFSQDAYVIRMVSKFDFSDIKRENSDKKAYASDWALVAAVEFTSSEDHGKLFENLVVLEFMKLQKQVFFYKQLTECDIVLKENDSYLPVQISYRLDQEDTSKREVKGLKDAANFLGVDRGLILTMDQEGELVGDIRVNIVPAFKYFTSNEVQLNSILA